MSKQILVITGGSGYLGRHLATKATETFEVYATYHRNAGRIGAGRPVPLDLTNREEVFRVIAGAKPNGFSTWCFPAWMRLQTMSSAHAIRTNHQSPLTTHQKEFP